MSKKKLDELEVSKGIVEGEPEKEVTEKSEKIADKKEKAKAEKKKKELPLDQQAILDIIKPPQK